MKSILFSVALLTSLTVMSQTFSIKRLEVAGDKINLYYDLVDTVSSRTYTIALYSSHDNFVLPVQKASGDLGLEVKPGRNRKIVWNAKEELGAAFNGKEPQCIPACGANEPDGLFHRCWRLPAVLGAAERYCRSEKTDLCRHDHLRAWEHWLRCCSQHPRTDRLPRAARLWRLRRDDHPARHRSRHAHRT